MQSIITFHPNGRFGNNVFQYIATKVFQSYLPNHVYHFSYPPYPENAFVITDENFDECIQLAKQGQLTHPFISLQGYFQFNQYIEDHQDYVRSLFVPSNPDKINPNFTMGHLAHYVLNYKSPFESDDLVLHIRLDDFIMDGKGSAIIHHDCYLDLLKSIRNQFTGKLYIIIDRIKYPFEQEYIRKFEDWSPIILTASMVEDFARCYWAPNFVLSNSTFCWIPTIFSPKRKNWFPQNVGIFNNQKFDRVNDMSVVYPTKRLSY